MGRNHEPKIFVSVVSVRRNTLWNLAGAGLPLLVAVALIPYILEKLGGELFGVLTLAWALIGYFGLFDLGVGRALTYEISKLRATQSDATGATLRAGLLLTAGAGLLGAAVLLAAAPPLATSWMKIDPEFQQNALVAFSIIAAGVIPTTINSGLRGALEGLGRFGASNLNKMLGGALMFALPAWSVHLHGPSIEHVCAYLAAARVLVAAITAMQLRDQWRCPAPSRLAGRLRALLAYGSWVTVSGVVGPLMVIGDRFVIGATLGIARLPFYAIPQEMLQRLLILPSALCGALLPRLAASPPAELRQVYRSAYRLTAVVMLVVCGGVAALAHPLLSWWLSPEFADTAHDIVLILLLGILINSMAHLPYTLLHAAGKPRVTALLHLLELALYLPLLYWLTAGLGLIGAAWAWMARVTLDWILLEWAVRRLSTGEKP